MKIARRKRAQAGNWVFHPGNAEMCAPRSIDRPHERTQTRALNERGPLGPGGGNGRHDRTPLFAQSKGDFRPKKTLSKS